MDIIEEPREESAAFAPPVNEIDPRKDSYTEVVTTIPNPEAKLPTAGEYKLLRKQYVTIQHPRVVACQHRLDLHRQPRHRNCDTCWLAWFQNHEEVVKQLDEMFTEHGAPLIVQLQGKKFYHRWRQFMATIAQWQLAESNEVSTESTE